MNPDYGAAPSAIPLFPKARKVQAPYGAQVQAAIGLTPLAAPVPPTERAGSKGSFICRCLGQRKPYNRPAGVGNAFPPLVAGATTFPPQAGALWMLNHGAMSLQESIERFIMSPGWGKIRRSRKGGGERSEPIRKMLIMPYGTESKSRNAEFNNLRQSRYHNPRPEGPSNLRTFRPIGPVNPKNPHAREGVSHEPSHRRRVLT